MTGRRDSPPDGAPVPQRLRVAAGACMLELPEPLLEHVLSWLIIGEIVTVTATTKAFEVRPARGSAEV
jgi:hypothetical protein